MVEEMQRKQLRSVDFYFHESKTIRSLLPGFSQSTTIATWEGDYNQQRAIDLALKNSQGLEVAVVTQIADLEDNIRKLFCFSTFLLASRLYVVI